MAKRAKLGRHLYWRGPTIYGWYREEDGTIVKRSAATADPELAAQRLAQWERDAANPLAAAQSKATLGQAFDLYDESRASLISSGKRSEDSLHFYGVQRRVWCTYAGRLLANVPEDKLELSLEERKKLVELGEHAALSTVDQHFTDSFIEHRRTIGTSENTISKNRTIFRAVLAMCKRKGLWKGDLDELFPPGFEKGSEPKRVFWTQKEGVKVLDELLPHRRAQASFILATGAELRAVTRAKREDFKLVPIVPLRGTKTKDRDRTCPIVTSWQKKLLAFSEKHADGEGEQAFTLWRNSSRDLALACKRANVQVVSLHGLRHIAGAWMLDSGLSEGVVAKLLGHRDLRMISSVYDTRDPSAVLRRAQEQVKRFRTGSR